jgi:Fungal specific transcription factor domain
MTYWYETPDDQKDTWHWMGVAISLAHTIGLHRDPEKSHMPPEKQKLWKRIWWSCFMRDRLVALGMRRPTRIKAEDYDVPMLTLNDFEIQILSDDNTSISEDCTLIRDINMQKDLAVMCMAKARLCLIISHVLSAQYSVLVKYQAAQQGQDCNTRSNVMLFPKKHDQIDEVKRCDQELTEWFEGLEPQAQYRKPNGEDSKPGRSSIIVQRGLLHMVYYATLSALHRPQVLPSAEITALEKCRELQDVSRKKVREASREITSISVELYNLRLSRFLPTTGVTVILPAIIIHLLDIKSSSQLTRDAALQGFCHCMRVLERLRENYAAADYATQFLEAAIRKANIDVTGEMDIEPNGSFSPRMPPAMKLTMPRPKKIVQNVGQLMDAGRAARITPPPENNARRPMAPPQQLDGAQPMSGLFVPSTSSPPDSDSSHAALNGMNGQDNDDEQMLDSGMYVDESFESSLVDYNGNGGMIDPSLGLHSWSTGIDNGMHGESGGFIIDMNWNDHADMWSNSNLMPHGLGDGGLMRHRLGENNLMRQGLGDGSLLRQGLGEGGLMHQGLGDGSLMHQGLGEMGGQDLTSGMEL